MIKSLSITTVLAAFALIVSLLIARDYYKEEAQELADLKAETLPEVKPEFIGEEYSTSCRVSSGKDKDNLSCDLYDFDTTNPNNVFACWSVDNEEWILYSTRESRPPRDSMWDGELDDCRVMRVGNSLQSDPIMVDISTKKEI